MRGTCYYQVSKISINELCTQHFMSVHTLYPSDNNLGLHYALPPSQYVSEMNRSAKILVLGPRSELR